MTIDRPGLLFFMTLVAALISLQWAPEPASHGTWRPLLTYRVDTDHPVSFHVPPGTREIKLIALAEPEDAGRGPVTRQHYVLQATWLDADDATVHDQALSVYAGRSAYPTSVRSGVQTSPVLDPRTIRLPVPDSTTRRLILTTPVGSEPVRVRTFRDLPVRMLDNDPLVGLGRRDAVRLARRIGREAWSEVHHAEAQAMASQRWEAMRPLYGTGTPVSSTITNVVDPAMPAQVRRAASVELLPGRSLAYRLRGPVDALIVADGNVDALDVSAIAHDHGVAPLTLESVDAPTWATSPRALRIRSDATTEVSLHLHNQSTESLQSLLMLVEGASSRLLPPGVEAAPLASLLPQASHPDTLAVVPILLPSRVEFIEPGVERTYDLPASPDRDVVRLTLRALRKSFDADEPEQIELRITHEDGSVDERVLTIPVVPSTFERMGLTGDAMHKDDWVSDRVERFVHLGPGAMELAVTARGPVAIAAHSPGAPHGHAHAVSTSRRTRTRYARGVRSEWVRLPTTNLAATDSEWLLWGNMREELVEDEDAIASNTSLRSALASQQGSGDRTWLLEAAGPSATDIAASAPLPMVPTLAIHESSSADTGLPATDVNGLVYCGYRPSTASQSFPYDRHALQQTGGFLSAVLWAPSRGSQPILGDPFSVSLDGATWIEGRVRTDVQRRRGHRPPARSLQFSGPPGARLWLRTWLEPGESCRSPRRPRATRHLEPGQTTRFTFERSLDDHLVFVGGLGNTETPLRVRVITGAQDPSTASPEAWTRRTRTLTLTPGDPRTAIAIDQPWLTRPTLHGQGMRLGADLPLGTTTLEVHHMGSAPVELFVLYESAEAGTPEVTMGRGRR